MHPAAVHQLLGIEAVASDARLLDLKRPQLDVTVFLLCIYCRLVATLLMTCVSIAISPEVHGLRKSLPARPDVQSLVPRVSVVGGGVIERQLVTLAGPASIIISLFLPVLVRPMETWEISSMIHRALTPTNLGGREATTEFVRVYCPKTFGDGVYVALGRNRSGKV